MWPLRWYAREFRSLVFGDVACPSTDISSETRASRLAQSAEVSPVAAICARLPRVGPRCLPAVA